MIRTTTVAEHIIRCVKNIVFILVCAFTSSAQEKHVLFIGNSLTYYNDMPQTVQKMIDEKKLQIKIEQATHDGWQLVTHTRFNDIAGNLTRINKWETSATVKKILSRSWDIIVLQEGTVQLLIPEDRYYWTEPALSYLDSVIKSKNGKTILYQNYALPNYPAKYCFPVGPRKIIFKGMAFDPDGKMDVPADSVCSDSFRNSGEEFKELEQVYKNFAKSINADIAEVGRIFEICKKKCPDIPLFADVDDDHPSKQGSYLIACVFFRSITKEHLKDIIFSADIDNNIAKKLRDLVDASLP